MEAILVAVIGTLGLLGNTWLSHKAKQAAENVDRKTATNHGKEPWEYLEMVQDVRDDIQHVRADMLEMRRAVIQTRENTFKQAMSQEDLHVALIEHTAQDSDNFDYLIQLMTERNDSGS